MLRGFAFNKWDIFPLYSLHIDSLSFVLPRNRGCAHAGCLASFEYYHRHGKTARLLTQGLGQREMGSCGEMVNVNLNRGGNVIISKSAEPSRPGGRGVDGHFTSRACRAERPGAWLPIPSGGFVSSSTKFSKHMQAHKGVENWGICLGDMAKVNELVLPFSGGKRKGGRGLARHLNPPPPPTETGLSKGGLPAFKWDEHCQIYTLTWFQPTPDNPFPEINCPIKMKCCPYRFNKLKTLVWILGNLDGIPSM